MPQMPQMPQMQGADPAHLVHHGDAAGGMQQMPQMPQMPGAGPAPLVHHGVPGDAAGMRWVEDVQRPFWPGYETGAHVPGPYPPQLPPGPTGPPGPWPEQPNRGWSQGSPDAHDPDVRVDLLSSEVTNKAIEEFFWQVGVKTTQVVQSSGGGIMLAHVWLASPAMLGQALGLNGQMLQGQNVQVQSCKPSMHQEGKGCNKGDMGSQEGKGKGWGIGKGSSPWQQQPREIPPRQQQPGGEASSPERDQDKDQDRQKPQEVKPKTQAPPVVPESSEPPETTAVYCPECQTWLNGPRQWEDHKIGKKHRKNVQKQRAGASSGSTNKAASPKKANEPIVAPPEREETEGKSEMADWLNAGVDAIVKSQVREGAKAADGEVSEDPKKSRRSRRRKKDGDQEKGEKSGPDPEWQANDDHDDDDKEKVPQTPTVDVEAPPGLAPALQEEAALVPAN